VKLLRTAAIAVAGLTLLGACTANPDPNTNTGPSATVLRVLAGSELADLKPILEQVQKQTGVTVKLDFAGTLDGADQVAKGAADGKYDAIWFSSNRYLSLNPQAAKKIGQSEKIMASPVVLGLRHSVAAKLGWSGKPVSWSDIAAASAAKKFTYGMTDPSASNSGFSALVGVASALANTGGALNESQIQAVTPKLKDFFASQTLSAGSSGWLSDAFVQRSSGKGTPVDGLINYESLLLSIDASSKLTSDPLDIIYPSDGVVTADYPLTLLNSATPPSRTAFSKVVTALKEKTTQQQIVTQTHRRPVTGGVTPPQNSGPATLNELPFPAQQSAVNALLSAYFDKIRRPSRTLYVLDTSGSMEGQRLDSLKQALTSLAGADSSLSGRFSRFHAREQVTLLPFSSEPAQPQLFTVPETSPGPVLASIRATGQSLRADGNTAIYASLEKAYQIVGEQIAQDPNRFTSIVLMTDGENTNGPDLSAFRTFHGTLSQAIRGVPVFPVLFGDSATSDMQQIATITGGRTFDARSGSLAAAFKEIRGYQ
jgi:Ca-activated chloride channel family protein